MKKKRNKAITKYISANKIQIRSATSMDYPAVLALDPDHQIYAGNDYLPSEYFSYLCDPSKHIRVCEEKGKIVSLNICFEKFRCTI